MNLTLGSITVTDEKSTTFISNQRLPIHRWFRYSAGFSADWAENEIRRLNAEIGGRVVLDPFCGSGTTLLAAQRAGLTSIGIEAHPLVYRISLAKLDWSTSAEAFSALASKILDVAQSIRKPRRNYPSLLTKIYESNALDDLERLRLATVEHADLESAPGRLAWLVLVSILRSCSMAGTAPWQYVLPKKRKARVSLPFTEYQAQVNRMWSDMKLVQADAPHAVEAKVLLGNARSAPQVASRSVDIVITSPPYPNNYDYADATRLEQTFLAEINGWGDLQDAVRKHLIRSCSQHTASDRLDLEQILATASLNSIKVELTKVCSELDSIRKTKGGKKTYHTMIAGYFADMADALGEMARIVRRNGKVCMVIGDSAPYGVYIPVDLWLGTLAESVGFRKTGFEEVRKRNLKWKNRKHKVPLKEGRLWLHRE